ncbi:MAG TPA: hypothetical protein VF658_18265 [Pyrinomonadaceae bacterium]
MKRYTAFAHPYQHLWLAALSGMTLVGLSLEADREGMTRIHVMPGNESVTDSRRQTYTIIAVKRILPKCCAGGRD